MALQITAQMKIKNHEFGLNFDIFNPKDQKYREIANAQFASNFGQFKNHIANKFFMGQKYKSR
jgi:hypothetical protein